MSKNAPQFSWQIHHVDPETIKIPEPQLRKHPRSKIERLKRSIDRVGFYVPIVIDGDKTCFTGIARVLAARELGLATIPALQHDQLSPAQLRAIRIIDNKMQEGSSWSEEDLAPELADLIGQGFDGLDLGFETAEIDLLLAKLQTGLNDGLDDPVAPPGTPITRREEVWLLADHRIICADSRDSESIDKLMMGATAAACITDPPYNVPISGHVSGLGRHQHREFEMASGEMTDEQFESFLGDSLSQMIRAVRPGGCIYTFIDWRGAHLLTQAALDRQLNHVNTCVWKKAGPAMGSFYRSQHEFVLVFRKPGGKATNNVRLGRFGRSRSNVWEYAGANTFGRTRDEDLAAHPTVKPVGLIEDALKDCTSRGDIVIDLFGGSGTTMLAAERCGRKARLCEIDAAYVDVTLERFAKVFGVEAIHEATGLTYSQLKAQRLNGATA